MFERFPLGRAPGARGQLQVRLPSSAGVKKVSGEPLRSYEAQYRKRIESPGGPFGGFRASTARFLGEVSRFGPFWPSGLSQ